MKILLLSDGPIPHLYMNFRGNELVSYLALMGHKVFVVCPAGPGRYDHGLHGVSNLRFIYLRASQPVTSPSGIVRRILLLASLTIRARQLLKSNEIELIRAISFLPAVAAIIARGKRRIPLVTNLSDLYSDLYGQFRLPFHVLVSPILKFFEGVVAARCGALIVDSPSQRNKFVSLGANPRDVVVIPHGIPSDFGRTGGLDNDGFRPKSMFSGVANPDIVFYIGDISNLDGVDVLLRSVRLVLRHNDRVRFLVVGSGLSSYMQYLRNIVREEGVEKYVRFVRSIQHAYVQWAISQCDVCVAPFRLTETSSNALPNKILEYLATDVPIVCTKSPALLEMIGDHLCYVNVSSAQTLSEAIVAALSSGTDKAEIQRRHVLRNVLSWRRIVEREELLLERVVDMGNLAPLSDFDYVPVRFMMDN
jgi:glycosyltransferase involved in cell wall biosynthesis